MAKNSDNRVLGRRNASDVSPEELQKMLRNGNRHTIITSILHHPDN